MRIAIFGATGATGRHLVEQALERGHAVTAFARDRGALSDFGDRITVVEGDVQQADRVAAAVRGQDAVLYAVGVRRGTPAGTILSSGTRNVLDAMRASGVRRLVVQTGILASASRARMGPLSRLIASLVRLFRLDLFRDKDRQEEIVRGSGLAWTIVRPPRMVQGPRTGRYRAGPEVRPRFPDTIRFADVADFMLKQLESDELVGKETPILGR